MQIFIQVLYMLTYIELSDSKAIAYHNNNSIMILY